MENLTERVYECTLGVEAHMVCDLLARAGISARVDGEFLQGAGGDLPLGNSIKVRVAPEKAAEARAVIDEWEKLQPADPTPPPSRSSLAPLWFVTGLLVGAVGGSLLVAHALQSPATTQGIDFNDDGDFEIRYHYAGDRPSRTEIDRNDDGRIDERWQFGSDGLARSQELDSDFDGRFEWQSEVHNEMHKIGRVDRNGDGAMEEVWRFENGEVRLVEYFDDTGQRLVSRQRYLAGERVAAEFDRDGDGVFEQRVAFDRFGMPK
jgi:hypothetical protein